MDSIIKSGNSVNIEIINKYKDFMPKELLDIWNNYGFCTVLDGFLRMIDPDEYKDILRETYFLGKISLPIFVSVFGDIVFIQNDGFIGIVRYRYNNFNIVTSDFKHFLRYLKIDEFVIERLLPNNFHKAKEKLGLPQSDECYGYFPLLCTGGRESVDNIKIVKTKEHIILITQFVGAVGE